MHKKSQSGVSRRSFVFGTAAAGVGLAVGLCVSRRASAQSVMSDENSSNDVRVEWNPHAFVHVGPDNRVTVYSKHTEMGQGIYTGLATIVAEELDAAWEQMQVKSAPADTDVYLNLDWGEQATGGSSSISNSFDQLRQVAAATRAMLLAAAAERWGIPVSELTIESGMIQHVSSGRSSSFGDLAELAAEQPVPEEVDLKPADQYRWSRVALQRVDVAEKTNGRATFTQDLSFPGMRVALVAHAPRFGGSLRSMDDTAARAVPGVEDIVEIPTGVAVVADSFWTAQKARDRLSLEWDERNAFKMSSEEIFARYREIAQTEGAIARDDGSFTDAIMAAEKTLDAEYQFPYLAHAPIEPLNCVVHWSGEQCKIWSGTQQQTIDQADAADILGIPLENVEIQTQLAGGGFGRRACSDYASEAVHIAKALGPSDAPVKMMWTREDEMQAGNYRPLNYHRLRAGVDAEGNIKAWQHRLVGQSIAAHTKPEWIEDGVDGMSVNGAHNWLYDIPNVRVDTHIAELPVPVLWYRGVGATHTVFSVETFIDEIASLVGEDPLAYRLRMLNNEPRMAAVARLAADKSDWGSSLDVNRGRGIAICKVRGTYLAQVAEVSVRDDNSFSVDRVVTAIDCGLPVNRDVIIAQMEGGTGFGLSSTLGDEITLRDGYVEQENFDKYPLLRIQQMPDVDVHIVPSTEAPAGIGELAPMAAGAAVANALHTVTGKSYRSLPIIRAA